MRPTEPEKDPTQFTLDDVDARKASGGQPLIAESALASILQSLGTAPGFRDCMRECALTLHQWTHADGASVFRIGAEGHELEQIHSVGFPRALAEVTRRIGLQNSFTGHAVRQQQLIISQGLENDERIPKIFRELLLAAGFNTVAALPLMMHAQVVGAVTLAWRGRVVLSAEERDLLMKIGYGIAIAVEHDLREFESIRDSLTGLLNRREFDARLPQLIKACHEAGTPLSLVVMDLDNFKHCNDTHGHLLGDEILKSLANQIVFHMLMERGDVFRIGGEEFVLLLPHSSIEDCRPLIESIREDFAATEFVGRDGQPFSVTLSAGVAEYDDAGRESVKAFFGRADRAMYAAKSAGKNRIQIAAAEGDSG